MREVAPDLSLQGIIKTVLERYQAVDRACVRLAQSLADEPSRRTCARRGCVKVHVYQGPNVAATHITGLECESFPLLFHHDIERIDVAAMEWVGDRRCRSRCRKRNNTGAYIRRGQVHQSGGNGISAASQRS